MFPELVILLLVFRFAFGGTALGRAFAALAGFAGRITVLCRIFAARLLGILCRCVFIDTEMHRTRGLGNRQAFNAFLLDAFKYGVPPHAGLAYGLDRLVMLMAKADTIRDVIAFPKVKDASCLMTQSPSQVSEAQLHELGLDLEPEKEEKGEE